MRGTAALAAQAPTGDHDRTARAVFLTGRELCFLDSVLRGQHPHVTYHFARRSGLTLQEAQALAHRFAPAEAG